MITIAGAQVSDREGPPDWDHVEQQEGAVAALPLPLPGLDVGGVLGSRKLPRFLQTGRAPSRTSGGRGPRR